MNPNHSLLNKIAIGTAQLGMQYGVTNTNKIPSKSEVFRILEFANNQGIKLLDTAVNYGDSQKLIGDFNNKENFAISTKIPLVDNKRISENLNEYVHNSLSVLNTHKLDYCFLHSTEQLLGNEGTIIWESLYSLKNKGLINNIGLSVYEPKEIITALEKNYIPDSVQLPINLFDNRFDKAGVLDDLASRGIEIHARSIFLQGLLLKTAQSLPSNFLKWANLWKDLDEFFASNNLDRYLYLIDLILRDSRISKVVIGISSIDELIALVRGMDRIPLKNFVSYSVSKVDTQLIDPREWNKEK
jgi:aryl-alcohol dehydrogenase-like predicted oxidoreductase